MGITFIMYDLKYLKQAREDYNSLDNSQKRLVDKGINRIRERGIQAGKPLSGDLKECYKIKHRNAELRIVFRQYKDEIQVMQIVAIGKRDKKIVYKLAEQRVKH